MARRRDTRSLPDLESSSSSTRGAVSRISAHRPRKVPSRVPCWKWARFLRRPDVVDQPGADLPTACQSPPQDCRDRPWSRPRPVPIRHPGPRGERRAALRPPSPPPTANPGRESSRTRLDRKAEPWVCCDAPVWSWPGPACPPRPCEPPAARGPAWRSGLRPRSTSRLALPKRSARVCHTSGPDSPAGRTSGRCPAVPRPPPVKMLESGHLSSGGPWTCWRGVPPPGLAGHHSGCGARRAVQVQGSFDQRTMAVRFWSQGTMPCFRQIV